MVRVMFGHFHQTGLAGGSLRGGIFINIRLKLDKEEAVVIDFKVTGFLGMRSVPRWNEDHSGRVRDSSPPSIDTSFLDFNQPDIYETLTGAKVSEEVLQIFSRIT